MSTINIAMNAAQVVTASSQVAAGINAITASLANAKLESSKYSVTGELVGATLSGINAEGKKVTVTLADLNSSLRISSVRFNEVNASSRITKSAFNDIGRAVNELTGMFQRFVGFKALNAMNDALKQGFNNAREFQVQISLIRTISEDSQLSFNTWADKLKQVSDTTGLAIADVTKAAYDAISNQVAKGNDVFPFLTEAADLARTTGGTIAQAGNLMASAFNAYGKEIGTQREINALFFATIDEGRVTMDQMSNTFGRVAILGKGLGVQINELAASIAFLTQKGVTTDDAFTFMRNVFVQLEKPSESLTAFFKSIGVESGKAAVATYGFMGILQKIRAEVEGGNLEVAKLFPEIRAQQPIQAALNDFQGLERINQKFGDFTKLVETYNKAVEIRAESPADYINKEFNKLKNTFVVDIGQKLLDFSKNLLVSFGKISEKFTGDKSLSAGLDLILVTTRDLTIAFVAFRTASALAAAGVAAFGAASVSTGAAVTATTGTILGLNAALGRTIIGLGAAAIAYLATKLTFSNDLLSKSSNFESLDEDFKKLQANIIKTNATKLKPLFDETFTKNIDDNFKIVLQGLARFQVQADSQLNLIRESNRKTSDEFENSFQKYTDGLKNNINELGKKITEAQNLIDNAAKRTQSFNDSLNKTVDNLRLGNLSGKDRIEFQEKRIDVLKERAEALYNKGDSASIQEADRLLLEAASAYDDIAKTKVDILKKQAEQQGIILSKQQLENRGKAESLTLEERLTELSEYRLELSNKNVKAKQKEINIAKQQQEEQKKNLRDIEDKLKDLSKFSVYDAGGNLKPQYKDAKSGRVDTDKARKDYEALEDSLRESVSKTGKTNERIAVENLLTQKRKDAIAEINAIERTEATKTAVFRVRQSEKELKDNIAKNKVATEQQAKNLQDSIDKQIEAIKPLGGTIAESEAKALELRGSRFNTNKEGIQLVKDNTLLREQAKRDLQVYNEALQKAKLEQEDIGGGIRVPKQENIQAVGQAQAALKQTLRDLYTPLLEFEGKAPGSFYSTQVPGVQEKLSFERLETLLDNTVKQLFEGRGQLAGLKGIREIEERDYERQTKPLLDELKGISPNLFKDLEIANTNAASSAYRTADALDNLRIAIENLKPLAKDFVAPSPVDKASGYPTTGSSPTGRAFGGWVGRPSSVIGPDKYNMKLGDGEFVVNAESASPYADVLTDINRDRGGRNRQNIIGGNISSNTVGDITIIVNEAKDGQETGRQVWTKLRREMRRGNITPRN